MKPTFEQQNHLNQVVEYYDDLVNIHDGKEVSDDKDFGLLSEEMLQFRDEYRKKHQNERKGVNENGI